MEKRLIDYDDLSRKEKVEHIWEYYKVHFIGGLIGLFMLAWILNHYVINPPADIVFDMSIFTYGMDGEKAEEKKEELSHLVSDDLSKEVAIIESFNIDTNIDYTMQIANMTKIMAKTTLGDLDILVFVGDNYMKYLNEGMMMSLDEYIRAGIIPDIDEKNYTAKELGGTEGILIRESVYLVDVTELPFFEGWLPQEKTYYLGVFSNHDNEENIVNVLNYMFE